MPIGRILAKTGLTPNMITTLTLVVALVTAYVFYLGDIIVGFLLMLFTILLDMFDGAIARAAGLASKFGATYDHTLDRYAEYLFMLGLMMGPTAVPSMLLWPIVWWPYISPEIKFLPWFWGIFSLFGMIMASFTRAKAESVGGMTSCTVGIAERQEKLLLMFAGILLLALPPTNIWMDLLGLLPPIVSLFFTALQITNILTLLVVIVGVLSHITVVQRLAYAKKMIPH